MKRLVILLAVLALTGCENYDGDLWDQVSYKTQESPRLYNPEGSVPRFGTRLTYADADGATLTPPIVLDKGHASKGKALYDIYCLVCHGATGRSDTVVAGKMDVMPFDLTEEGTAELTDGEIFVKIVASDAVMPKYRNELTDQEAWEITAYVRQLQGKL